jgi:hypothetical protein
MENNSVRGWYCWILSTFMRSSHLNQSSSPNNNLEEDLDADSKTTVDKQKAYLEEAEDIDQL